MGASRPATGYVPPGERAPTELAGRVIDSRRGASYNHPKVPATTPEPFASAEAPCPWTR